jgi:hypothetical protein
MYNLVVNIFCNDVEKCGIIKLINGEERKYMHNSIKRSLLKIPIEKKRVIKTLIIAMFFIVTFMIITNKKADALTVKTYTISSASKPYMGKYTGSSNYNSYTKQYFLVRSYLEQLEKIGGGVLYLKAGTYSITNTLYVPSNVTIKLEDGVIIKKGKVTGTTAMPPSSSIFQLAAPSKYKIEGVYSKYYGEKNIKFIALGKAIIDLNYSKNSIAIIMGHNYNVSVKGITFQNMYSGHFIEMDASNLVTIDGCTFNNHKDSDNNNKEAINLDTPDKTTEGFHCSWSSYDRTPNKNITIQNNVFTNLERAIGTHKYSENKYHTYVKIINNQITSCDQDAIRVMNWSSPTIQYNVIDTVASGSGSYRAILVSGVSNPIIKENTFKNTARPIQIMPWKNSGPGSQYAITYNTLTSENITDMLNNTLINVGERFIRYNKTYQVYDKDTEKYYFN